YAFSFELMPEMTLPEYAGIGVEEDEPKVEDTEIDEVIDRVRRGMAEREDVAEKRLAQDGDVVVMDFAGFDEKGEAVEGVSGENFQVSIGDNQVIPDFEALAKTVLPGESGEGQVKFPDDYGHAPLAGKTVTMKITVKQLQTRKLPEVDDEFAKKAGGFDSVQAMRDNIRETYTRNRKDMAKAKAQSLLLEKLLEKTTFPLPEGMVARYTQNIIHGQLEELSRQGKELPALDSGELTKMQEDAKAEAEKYARTQLFLLTVAKKEELEATGQEMTAALRQIAARGGHDIKEVQEHYARNNLFPALRDRILADKAMDRLYDKAAPEKAESKEEGEAKPAKSAKPKKAKAEKAENETDAKSE
ncbi:trigger factor, partial [Desulfovibrio sp. OttesenSCG-928-O18]|nr:trigger factor [Desulfovibrio sp. OttesenSCG-928-O18]